MSPTTLERPPARRVAPRTFALVAVLVCVAAVGVWIASDALRPPSTVARLDIVNPTVYPVEVAASGRSGGRVTLGPVQPNSTRSIASVSDRGEEWSFVFSYAGDEIATVDVSRAELESAGWSVRVPDEVARRLAEQGIEPRARDEVPTDDGAP